MSATEDFIADWIHDPADKAGARRGLEEIVLKVTREALLRNLGRMFSKPPCYICGYNGPNYFQEKAHPCAKAFHDNIQREG